MKIYDHMFNFRGPPAAAILTRALSPTFLLTSMSCFYSLDIEIDKSSEVFKENDKKDNANTMKILFKILKLYYGTLEHTRLRKKEIM